MGAKRKGRGEKGSSLGKKGGGLGKKGSSMESFDLVAGFGYFRLVVFGCWGDLSWSFGSLTNTVLAGYCLLRFAANMDGDVEREGDGFYGIWDFHEGIFWIGC